MGTPYISHEEATLERFRSAPSFAAEYLNSVLEYGNQQEIMLAIRRLADAFDMTEVANAAGLVTIQLVGWHTKT